MHNLLLVDDDRDAVESLARALTSTLSEYSIQLAHDRTTALERIDSLPPSVAVIDLSLNSEEGVESGFSLLKEIKKKNSGTQVIVLTGHGDTKHGLRAIELGARNFLVKPAEIDHLAILIHEATRYHELLQEYESLKRGEAEHVLKDQIVGTSELTKKLRDEIAFAASHNQPTLLLGETGVGKGLCARMIHQLSNRSSNAFVRYQPGLSKSEVLASELFGHTKGAFTGADEERKGIIRRADRGTFFLDEIDGLPNETQLALLGLLQEKVFRPVGGDQEISIDVRFISATNQEPNELIKESGLREDFYHRIAHLTIQIPSLRERKQDIPELVHHVVLKLESSEAIDSIQFADQTLSALMDYHWPGNVRELEGVVESACHRAKFAERDIVLPEDLSLMRQSSDSSNARDPQDLHTEVRRYKRQLVEEALKNNDNNQVHAAKTLGIDRTTLRRILASKE